MKLKYFTGNQRQKVSEEHTGSFLNFVPHQSYSRKIQADHLQSVISGLTIWRKCVQKTVNGVNIPAC